MKNEDIVRKINPGLVQADGRLKPFAEQLLEYEYGVYPKNAPFVISNVTMRLNDTLIPPHPITITQSAVAHIKKKHDISNVFIMRIENMLRNNVLIIESRHKKNNNSFVVVTDAVDKEDRPIVIILKKDYRIGYHFTNIINSMYGRTNIEALLHASFLDGCSFYPNEKTEHWLSSQGLQLPPDVTSALSYHYNIPDTLYCQAENLYQRKNRGGERRVSLDDQVSHARNRSARKKKGAQKKGQKRPVYNR